MLQEIMEKEKIKSTSKYPTTLIVKGVNYLGIEIAKTLIEQGGYVIIIDELFEHHKEILNEVSNEKLLTILDIGAIATIEDELRRLDYVFYFGHENKNFISEISSQQFLQESNYLDSVLDLSIKFDAKFLLTTSIKAHQIILEGSDLSMSPKTLPKYSETEIQRYAENLTLEYQSKLNLDTRIIRLGELLGKGMNAQTELSYLKLITAAVNGKNLEIGGDGLETDFYIHYVDGAKGLIKAMFSLNTKGKTFSLSIPEEISLLSIAYKILDIEPNSGEIRFVDFDSKLPPLRLYKPAPSLSTLGWEYKVNIERAIAQTIEYVKEREDALLRKEIEERKAQEGEDPDLEDKTPSEPNADGALARLIAERKIHEKSRVGSVVVANQKLKARNKKQSGNILDRASRRSFWVFENFKSQFKFLKNITLREFVFYILLGFLAFLGYIFIFSPILNLSTNAFKVYQNIQKVNSNIEENDYKNASNNLVEVNYSINEIQKRFEDLKFLFVMTGNSDTYNEFQTSLQTQFEYTESLGSSLKSLDPLVSHFTQTNSLLIQRTTEESIVDVQPSQDILSVSDVENNFVSLQLGIEKLKISTLNIEKSIEIYPDFITKRYLDEIQKINSNIATLESVYENYEYLAPMLGLNEKANYLIMIQDNTRYTSSGGAYSSYIYIAFENGVISEIKALSASEINEQNISLQEFEKNELNLVSTIDLIENTTQFKNTSYIKDQDIRLGIIKRVFEEKLNRKIDIVAASDLITLQSFLENEQIQVQNISINKDNFFTNLEVIGGESPEGRNEAITQITSSIVIDVFNNAKVLDRIEIIGNMIESGHLSFFTSDAQLKTLSNKYKPQISSSSDFLKLGINSDQTKPISKLPSISISGQITIDNNTVSKNLTLKLNSLDNIESSWICTPSGSKNFVFEELEPRFYSTNFSQIELCQIFTDPEKSEVTMQFDSTNYEKLLSSEYEYVFQLAKINGVNLEYNLEFIFVSSDSIFPEESPTINRTNRFIYSGTAQKDLIFRFTKNG